MYIVEIRSIKIEEYQKLRSTTGWDMLSDDVVSMALARSLFSVCVLNNGEVIGIGRVVGDGALYFYIQDVIVMPHHQQKGVGKLIMKAIEEFLKSSAPKNAFIGLMAAKGVENFYLQFGYQPRPDDRPGMFRISKPE